MSNPYPHLCPYTAAVEGGLPCECPPVPDNVPTPEKVYEDLASVMTCECGSAAFAILEQIITPARVENGVVIQVGDVTESEVLNVCCSECGLELNADDLRFRLRAFAELSGLSHAL